MKSNKKKKSTTQLLDMINYILQIEEYVLYLINKTNISDVEKGYLFLSTIGYLTFRQFPNNEEIYEEYLSKPLYKLAMKFYDFTDDDMCEFLNNQCEVFYKQNTNEMEKVFAKLNSIPINEISLINENQLYETKFIDKNTNKETTLFVKFNGTKKDYN